jgi:hypothetical protein
MSNWGVYPKRVLLLVLFACGARTSLDVTITRDPTPAPSGSGTCAASTVVGDVYGAARYFADGGSLAPGSYRVTYVDGCMKYSDAGTWGAMGWTVQAYADGATGKDWFLVSAPSTPLGMPPGTSGFLLDGGAFASFDDCVAANHTLGSVDVAFDGGRLGVWLYDSPYGDNVPGIDGRNPTWKLECR